MNLWYNIKESYKHIPYTLKHKKAMLMLEKKFLGHNSLRILLHDSDKILLYIFFPFLTLHANKTIHRKLNKHHHYDEIYLLNDKIIREIVLDWESAHYTKPDKPETARDFCLKNKPGCFPYVRKYLDAWGI